MCLTLRRMLLRYGEEAFVLGDGHILPAVLLKYKHSVQRWQRGG